MSEQRWSVEQANAWYAQQPWLVGCNFIPSTAINQLEMWQEETFDAETLDRELGWAEAIGFNTVRVYLHDLLWEADKEGFIARIHRYLEIADRHYIRTLFTIFDDCWNNHPKLGKQPEPLPGIHNSGWVQSPSTAVVTAPEHWSRLEMYVTELVRTFGQDERILFWDLYNEPGNNHLGTQSLPLLKEVFGWARAAAPSQPLSVGIWFDNAELNAFQAEASDIITFHNYRDTESLKNEIASLRVHGRPLICTEYMARTSNSLFLTHLPIFQAEKVGCYNWGFVSGKTQTIYPWGSAESHTEPELWFHDLFRQDGTPYRQEEVDCIKHLTGR